ncbi:beta-1,6-N-acetylglucosaminyltransferase [Larkinella insperata]|uniref:Peptide O-xylosyltransferase n=1 Tax=Larkinella insperata TaxID=332158 RepID=A0ABW3Q0E0_9BACT|nr:beta-1,6-N-acetylglucosaminyltransferase [Larkinella insperata]
MKLAHLILAHAQPEQLDRLIRALQHPDADFYVHVDQKTDIGPFLKLQQYKNVYLVRKRQRVSWGAYSIVQATLNGFEQIMASAIPYDYVNLLSGQDYPLKSPDYIHHFLQKQSGTQFMEYYSVENEWQEAIPRIRKYHLTNYSIPGKHKLEKLLNSLLPDRKVPENLTLVGRSQWFTITQEAVKYILLYLQMHSNVRRFFELTWGADELVFQTLLYNSPFQSRMLNDNLRYIDWSEGKASPKTLTATDEATLRASGKLFARKFNATTQPEILDLLDANYLSI